MMLFQRPTIVEKALCFTVVFDYLLLFLPDLYCPREKYIRD